MQTYLAVLGRQPELSQAELECIFMPSNVRRFSDSVCTFKSSDFPDIQTLGGSLKLARHVSTLHEASWHDVSKKVTQIIKHHASRHPGKVTLGISLYDWHISPRDIQKLGLSLKRTVKATGGSMRLIPNAEPALSTATSHHNKLGLSENKLELIIARNSRNDVEFGLSIGAQNITALAARDQERPKRDAFVGMLPPKLALMMVNMAHPLDSSDVAPKRLLDPFCGTGVVLQEAALLGHDVYGTDLNPKMIEYTNINLDWLKNKYDLGINIDTKMDDAINASWQAPIDVVVSETYLGQPFSAPPSPAKLQSVQNICGHIVESFLENLRPQLPGGIPLCIAVPAWKDINGNFSHLGVTKKLDQIGYARRELSDQLPKKLLYHRDDQVVARELLLLITK